MRTQTICLALVLVLVCPYASGQWVKTAGPYDGSIRCFAVSGTNLFAGTSGGVILSTNNGTSWTAVNTGLTRADVRALAVSGTNVFAGTGNQSYGPVSDGHGVFRSTDNGTSWTAVNEGLPKDTYDTTRYLSIQCFASSGTSLFAGTWDGVFLSTDNGTSWTAVNTGLTNTQVFSLAVSGTKLFAGTQDGVFLSTNNGTSWIRLFISGLPHSSFWSLAISGTNLFAGTDGSGVFLSTDSGTSWTQVFVSLGVHALAVSGTNLFVGDNYRGVFLYTNNIARKTPVNTGLTNIHVSSLAVSGTNLFAGTEGGGVWSRPLSEMITSVEPVTSQLPHEFSLRQNYPNPFNPSTTICYELPRKSAVRLTVFNNLGQQVAQLANGDMEAGYHEVQFDGSESVKRRVLLSVEGR